MPVAVAPVPVTVADHRVTPGNSATIDLAAYTAAAGLASIPDANEANC